MDTRLVGRIIDAQRAVNPLLAVSAAVLDLKQPPASGSVRAQVAARLADGTFRVLIDGKALKLALPDDIQAGDVLQLRVVGREGSAPGQSAAAAAGGAGKGVSTAGQLVADLVKQPPASPTRQSQPVLSLPPDDPGTLAAPLARAVERSGLFYESHQARWVSGEFPLERLLEEPQAQAGRAAATPAPAATDRAAEAAPTPAAAAAEPADTDSKSEPARLSDARDPRPAEKNAADRSSELVAREALPIVRQQLETLETRQFQWLGEIWPGQTMHWEIGEEPERSGQAADAEHAWDSRFALDLPALGHVGAELALAGHRLRIRMSAPDAATVAMMREYGRELTLALAAAGVEPLSFEVQQRDPTL